MYAAIGGAAMACGTEGTVGDENHHRLSFGKAVFVETVLRGISDIDQRQSAEAMRSRSATPCGSMPDEEFDPASAKKINWCLRKQSTSVRDRSRREHRIAGCKSSMTQSNPVARPIKTFLEGEEQKHRNSLRSDGRQGSSTADAARYARP